MEGNGRDCTLPFSGLLLLTPPTPASSFPGSPYSPSLTYIERNGVANKLGVLLHHLFDTPLLQVLCLVFLQIQDHFGAPSNGFTYGVERNTLAFQGIVSEGRDKWDHLLDPKHYLTPDINKHD